MKTTRRSHQPAFTLIELLAVITIIVILASLVVSSMGFVTERQNKEKAKVQIALLSRGLEEYKLDMGIYPLTPATSNTDGTNNSGLLYEMLFYEGYDYVKQSSPATWTKTINGVTYAKSTKIYIKDLDPSSTRQGWVDLVSVPVLPTTVKDPWGNEYRYRTAVGYPPSATLPAAANAATMNPDFDLWSCGKDGYSDPSKGADYYDSATKKGNRDDIKNF